MKPVYLMSPPRADWALKGKANFRSIQAGEVDAQAAQKEWAQLADAIVAAGGEVLVAPPDPTRNLTGMVYTAEAGEFYIDPKHGPSFILPNMSAEHRRRESAWLGGFFAGLGVKVKTMNATWEAQGDALRCPSGIIHTYGEGKFQRTDEHAYAEVAGLLSENHIQIKFKADPWFHGNTFLNVYTGASESGALVCEEAVEDFSKLKSFLGNTKIVKVTPEASMNYDTNSLQVNRSVIASETISEKAKTLFSDLGLETKLLSLVELFTKGGGAPVCLTNRLWHCDVSTFPETRLWSACPDISKHLA